MKIAIYGQFYNENSDGAIQELFDELQSRNSEIYVESGFYTTILKEHGIINLSADILTFEELDNTYDLLISIGGDGTILRASILVKDYKVPIVGINTGRLGFLATIQKAGIKKAIDDIFNNRFSISKRSLLSIRTEPKHPDLEELNFALNEIAISRKNTTSMITVETHLNDEYLTSYWADGLIVSTPTGSTGYSLSCGGPVIMPGADSLIITPIAPHNLSARPLVIADDTEIRLKVSGREDYFLISLDSRLATLSNETVVFVKRADFDIHMIELEDESFLKTLRKKLLWGEDRRN